MPSIDPKSLGLAPFTLANGKVLTTLVKFSPGKINSFCASLVGTLKVTAP